MERVELCTGRAKDGREFYAFLQLDAESYDRYRETLSQNRPVDLNAFGKILHAGWGRAPDPSVSEQIIKKRAGNFRNLETTNQDILAIAGILKKNSREYDAQD
jgi:hypothetical protein